MNLDFLKPTHKLDYSDKRFYNAMMAGTMVGIPVHFIAFLYYHNMGIDFMAFLNLGGGFVFLYMLLLIRKSKFKITYWLAAFTVVFVTWFDTAYIGWNSGFHYFILLLIPVFFLYSKWSKIDTFIAMIVAPLSYVFTYWIGINYPAKFPLSEEEAFYSDATNFVASLVVFLIVIVYFNRSIHKMEKDLTYINKRLKRGNDEKEVLLKEIHHRVKNNLHVVNSILELQILELKDEKIKSYLKDAQRRILSMASIHERMYGSESLKHISASEYIESLIKDLARIYDSENKVKIKLDFKEVELDLDIMAPLAFLVNEIITNSYKHAFSESSINPTISASLSENNNRVNLMIGDNGTGFMNKTEDSEINLGSDLIESFIEELKADYTREVENGTVYDFSFDKEMTLPKIKEK